jgi:acetylglutamate kinase
MKQTLNVIKIGGNVIDNPSMLNTFLETVAQIRTPFVIIHGGGKIATQMAIKLDIPQTLIEGRRITDKPTLDIVTMVYAGLINKNIVSKLYSLGKTAVGLSGADGNVVLASKRVHPTLDYGYVGDVEKVNAQFLLLIIEEQMSPVLCAITHDANGQLLNTNADTIAQEVAVALAEHYEVSLIYTFEKRGVLLDVNNEESVIKILTKSEYTNFVNQGAIHSGMIPKLDNAFKAIDAGVSNVKIGKAEQLIEILNDEEGTKII